MGGITNIDQGGFGSAAFHSNPDMMRWDPYTGDYGMGFFGHAYAAASYLVDHPDFGWIAFGGEVTSDADTVTIVPHDGARSRLFMAQAGLWLTLDSGKIASARYDLQSGSVTIRLDKADQFTSAARLRIEQTLAAGNHYAPADRMPLVRGAYVIRLSTAPTSFTLRPDVGRSQ
jgi:hypothetical protein